MDDRSKTATAGRGTDPNPRKPKTSRRAANGLVALSSAAIIAVYAAGYARTVPAAASLNSPVAIAASVAASPSATAVATLVPTATAAATATAVPSASATAMATATTAAPTATIAVPTATTAAPTATVTATARAATATPAVQTTTAAYRDGTYTGSGTSRHGGVTVAVVIQGGKIVSAEITASNTRYPIAKIASLPAQVVARQGSAVDVVSGSTDSSTAFRTAVANALAAAK